MTDRVQTFLLNLTIIEGRHFPPKYRNSAVYVRVANKKKCTPICYGTDSPYFNQYFDFEFSCTLDEFLEKTITLTAFQPRWACIPRRTIGYISLDVATVWAADDHLIYHKWAALVPAVKDKADEIRGFLKVDIGIVRRGQKFRIPVVDQEATDEIEGNLLQADHFTTDRQKATYTFRIHYGDLLTNVRRSDLKHETKPEKRPPKFFLQVFFAGKKGQSSVKKRTASPLWNEAIVIPEYYPPLCQRIKVNVYDSRTCSSKLIATRIINLSSISMPEEYGILPMYGPTFLHLYAGCNKNEAYMGKILTSFLTETTPNVADIVKRVTVRSIPHVYESSLWTTESVLLCGVIFHCNLLGKKLRSKQISFEISFGHNLPWKDHKRSLLNRTLPKIPTSENKMYWCVDYGLELPCLYSKSDWPDLRHRLFLENRLVKVIDKLKLRLSDIERLVLKQNLKRTQRDLEAATKEAYKFLSDACTTLVSECGLNQMMFATPLENRRHKMRTAELNKLAQKSSEIEVFDKESLRTLYDMVTTLEYLAFQEESWPNVYVTMVVGKRKIAFAKFPPNQLVYSSDHQEKGNLCGVRQGVLLRGLKRKGHSFSRVVARVEMILWIGLESQKTFFLKGIPNCYTPLTGNNDMEYPPFLQAQESHEFQARVHIYQGKFPFGSDKSGLSDPFVRVIIGSHCKKSEVSHATLNPLWDETLVFPKLVLGGSRKYIKSEPPEMMIEVFDQDSCNRVEFLGRCVLIPKVKCADTAYKPPTFPPKLAWYKIIGNNNMVTGEIMISGEILELTTNEIIPEKKGKKDVIRVPSDIKPHKVKYRIEIDFWGVRDLHRINLLPVMKPRVILECVYASISSDSVPVFKGSLNFRDNPKHIDVNLPQEVDYIPPLCMKLVDNRTFDKHVLVGVQLFDMLPFLYEPETAKKRNAAIFGENYVDPRDDTTFPMSSLTMDSTTRVDPSKSTSKTIVREINESRSFKSASKMSTPKSTITTTESLSRNEFQTYYFHIQKMRSETMSDQLLQNYPKSASEYATPLKKSKAFTIVQRSERTPRFDPAYTREGRVELEKMAEDAKKTSWTILAKECLCPKFVESPPKFPSDIKLGEFYSMNRPEPIPPAHEDTEIPIEKKQGPTERLHIGEKRESMFCWPIKTLLKTGSKKSADVEKNQNLIQPVGYKEPRKKIKLCSLPWLLVKCILTAVFALLSCFCSMFCCIFYWFCCPTGKKQKHTGRKPKEKSTWSSWCFGKGKEEKEVEYVTDEVDDMELDWWTKYHDSCAGTKIRDTRTRKMETLKIYTSELEEQPEFEGFQDGLQIFQMSRENRTGDDLVDEENIKGTVKAAIQIYRLPNDFDNGSYVTPTGCPLEKGVFQDFYSNDPISFLVRVYCLKGINLRPKDINGKSDPYIRIIMGNQTITDRNNYIPKQVNPVFGRCFELKGTFPQNHLISIQIWDYDVATADDFIGETKIDMENRFYTKYRARCGIAEHYYTTGYCAWRDYEKPTTILANVCKKYNLGSPTYSESTVKIGTKIFAPHGEDANVTVNTQVLALYALRNWKDFPSIGFEFVPEHVETRSLYHYSKPGIEQGKLEMWMDIFPFLDVKYPEKVDVAPRKPVAYELRVTILNTEDVILQDDDYFIGEKMSDIYVKGWMISPKESQCTDVHYRSMTGEGSFNWRFVFPFFYLSSENLVVVYQKEGMFSRDESERKIPCNFMLQLWDKDALTSDDFLGSLSLELVKMPRGSREAKRCYLENLEPDVPTMNLFKHKHTRGWWPVPAIDNKTRAESLAGKVEMDLELLTKEEADKDPVGLGRADPHALDMPTRPSSSFAWYTNPFKAIKAIILQQNKWRCLKIISCAFLIYLILSAIQVAPKAGIERLIRGAKG